MTLPALTATKRLRERVRASVRLDERLRLGARLEGELLRAHVEVVAGSSCSQDVPLRLYRSRLPIEPLDQCQRAHDRAIVAGYAAALVHRRSAERTRKRRSVNRDLDLGS